MHDEEEVGREWGKFWKRLAIGVIALLVTVGSYLYGKMDTRVTEVEKVVPRVVKVEAWQESHDRREFEYLQRLARMEDKIDRLIESKKK